MYFLKNGEGTDGSVTVAVQRAESDLGGTTGRKAYDYVLKQNKAYRGGAKFVKLAGIGKVACYVVASLASS